MTNNKKLFTITVEDTHSCPESELLNAAVEAATEYSVIYNWSDISVSKSNIPTKKNGNIIFHYFDIFGKGDAIKFTEETPNTPSAPNTSDVAAKDVNP